MRTCTKQSGSPEIILFKTGSLQVQNARHTYRSSNDSSRQSASDGGDFLYSAAYKNKKTDWIFFSYICYARSEQINTVQAFLTVRLLQKDSSSYGRLHKTPFFSTPIQTQPANGRRFSSLIETSLGGDERGETSAIRRLIQTLYFYVPVSGRQLQLLAPFLRPEGGVRLRELRMY